MHRSRIWFRKQGAAGVRGHNTDVHPFTSMWRPESKVLFQERHFPVYCTGLYSLSSNEKIKNSSGLMVSLMNTFISSQIYMFSAVHEITS